MSIGDIIKKAREEKGINIEDLAKYIDKSKSSISDLELYGRMPKFDTMCMLCELLDIDMKLLWESIKPEYIEKLQKKNKEIYESISLKKQGGINNKFKEKEKRIQRGDG